MEDNRNIPPKEYAQRAFASGCAIAITEFVGILLIAFFCLLFGSCASHKIIEHNIITSSDSLTDNTEHIVIDTSSASTSTSVSTDQGEIITEHIVTVTDSLGNTSTTTDRTIRRRQSSAASTTDLSQNSTTAIDKSLHTSGHTESHDSLNSESSVGGPPVVSLSAVSNILSGMAFIIALLFIMYLSYEYSKSRHHE